MTYQFEKDEINARFIIAVKNAFEIEMTKLSTQYRRCMNFGRRNIPMSGNYESVCRKKRDELANTVAEVYGKPRPYVNQASFW